MSKGGAGGDRGEKFLCDSGTIDTPRRRLGEALQVLLLDGGHVLGNRRHLWERGKDEIDTNAAVLHLDDGHVSLLDWHKLLDVLGSRHFLERGREGGEEVVDGDIFGANN